MGLLLQLFIVSAFVAVLHCAPAEDITTPASLSAATNKPTTVPLLATQQAHKKDDSSESKASKESSESHERATRDVEPQTAAQPQNIKLSVTTPQQPNTPIVGKSSSSVEDKTDKSKEQKTVAAQPVLVGGSRQRRDTPQQQKQGQKTKDNPKIVPLPAPVGKRSTRDVAQQPSTDSQKTKDNPKISTLPAKVDTRPVRDTAKTLDTPKAVLAPHQVNKPAQGLNAQEKHSTQH